MSSYFFSRLIVAEAHYHVCVFSITHYYGNATNPGVQVPLNYHLLTIVRKNDLVESVERAIQFWFEVTGNNTPNWVVSVYESFTQVNFTSNQGQNQGKMWWGGVKSVKYVFAKKMHKT